MAIPDGYVQDEQCWRREGGQGIREGEWVKWGMGVECEERRDGWRLRVGDPLADSPAGPPEADWCPPEADTTQVRPEADEG